MQMRLRRTFEEVTAEIMKDQAAFLDILSRPRPPARQKISEGYNPPDLEIPTAGRVPRRPRGASLASGRAKVSGTRGGAETLARSRRRTNSAAMRVARAAVAAAAAEAGGRHGARVAS